MPFVRQLVLFVVLSTVVVGLGEGVVRHAANVYKDGAAVIAEAKRVSVREGKLAGAPGARNVVSLGDSRMLAGFVPDVFDAAVGHGVHAVNLALPALPIGPGLNALRDYVARSGAPAYVILYLRPDAGASEDNYFDHYANQGSTFAEVVSYAYERRDTGVLMARLNPMSLYEALVKSWVLAALFHPQALADIQATNEARVAQMLRDRGQYTIVEQRLFPSGRLPDDYDPGPAPPESAVDLDRDPYVSEFFAYAAKLKISVLLVEVPARKAPATERTEMPAWYRAALARYPNVKMARDGWRVKKYPNRLFSDPVHVNVEGATLFTRSVAEEFEEVYGPSF